MPDTSTTSTTSIDQLTAAAVEAYRNMRRPGGLSMGLALGILATAYVDRGPDVLHAIVTAVLAETEAETGRAVAEIEAIRAERLRRTFVTANLESAL